MTLNQRGADDRRHAIFLVPRDLGQPTGGHRYDRQIMAGLRDAGWQVDALSLDASYPWPDARAQAQTAKLIDSMADGASVVVDGLAFGAMPEVAERHAKRLRWVALVHHPLAQETGLSALQQAHLKASEQRSLAVAEAIIVTSRHTAKTLVDWGISPERITVVEPGTQAVPVLDSPQPSMAVDTPSALSLLCVATLTCRKGHQVLIEALAGLKDRAWTLDCVGSLALDPNTVAAVRLAIQSHGLQSRVRLHGVVADAVLESFYRQADLFVLPSHFEGYGMALAEALAHGLPVCSTTAGAIAETVPADAGVLLPAGDVMALQGALARLLDEPDWHATLSEGARRAALQLPTWSEAASRFAQVLAQVDQTVTEVKSRSQS